MDGELLWITSKAAQDYFGAHAEAMVQAGLRPVAKNRFWLDHVHSYAECFMTTRGETVSQALSKFKSKNRRMQQEIMFSTFDTFESCGA